MKSPLPEIEPNLYASCVLYCLNTFLHLFPAWNIKEILELLVCTDCTFNALFYIFPLRHPCILNNARLPCCHSLHVQISKIFLYMHQNCLMFSDRDAFKDFHVNTDVEVI